MTIDLTDLSQVSKIIGQIEGSENRDRKSYEWQSYEIYSGDQKKHTLNELKKMFPESHKSMRVSNINVLAKVVKKIAKCYKEPPVRTIGGEESEDLTRIYKNKNKAFKRFDTSYTRHKNSLIWVQNDKMLPTEFNFRVLDPYLFDLVIDVDTNKVLVVIMSYPDTDITEFNGNADTSKVKTPDGKNQLIAESQQDASGDKKVYTLWSDTNHVVVNSKKSKDGQDPQIDFVMDDNNPNQLNPLGMLPFVWATTDPDVPDFPISNPLAAESININLLQSDLLTGNARNILGLMTLKYPEGSQIKQLHSGFDILLELPQKNDPDAPATEAEFININSDIPGARETINIYAESVISDHGLQNFSLAGSNKDFSSGFDRALSMADVTEIREENKDTYHDVEIEVFNIIKKYDEVNSTRMFKPDSEISIAYRKPRIIQSDKEVLEVIKLKEELELIEDFEKIMILDPNTSEDEARDKLKRIRDSRQGRAAQFVQGMNDANKQEPERKDDRSQRV